MILYIIPMNMRGFEKHNVAVRIRKDEDPALFMQNVVVTTDGKRNDVYSYNNGKRNASLSIFGDIQEGMELQDNDILLIQARECNHSFDKSVMLTLEKKDGAYLSEGVDFSSISIASCMEKRLCACIADSEQKNVMSTAVQVFNKTMELYKEYPAFKNIMVKDDEGNTCEQSLLELIATQDEKFVKWAETMLLSMDMKYNTLFPVAKQILEQSSSKTGFTLLSREEQVAAFLEFSKKHADKAREIVPDRLVNYLMESPEYNASVEKLSQAGYGKSQTQQFNVIQQVGYFGGRFDHHTDKGDIIYNLSDMGAGKTLMTVQAIFMLDCINIGAWNREEKNEFVDVVGIMVPDKHIIAPALSVKASWVDTFRLFYDVEEDTDYHYILTMEYAGVTAKSHLYIAPFTVRSGKVFVHETLPEPSTWDTFLIVDEIHQLVKRRISRTKFFVPKIIPKDRYRIFALSGTMSNLKAGEWLYLIRFLGDTDILSSASESTKNYDKLEMQYREDISAVSTDIETLQHRKFNIDDVSRENRHIPTIKKKSAVDANYFMQYGSKLIVPRESTNGMTVQSVLSDKRYELYVEPEESDNVSFELFYHIAASSAITAQSLTVAQELFGEQATQHKASIIKTMSPFTDEEIMLLDTLHKIAADCNKYRSANIGRDINNAILNLNDGLQTKNLYQLVAGFAERNTKFLEYLSGLSVDILSRLPETSLVKSPALKDTHKFHVLLELLEKDKDETFLIVVNDYYAMKALADALGVECLTKQELKEEMAYQELLDGLFEKQNIVIVTQDMIKSSLDLVQANRLVQYQLNTEVSDIIQTQNRINRIGQKRETKCYYIAADRLQNALIELFLDSYRNIRVAHKGIIELFADLSSQIDVINDYLDVAFKNLNNTAGTEIPEEDMAPADIPDENDTDLIKVPVIPRGYRINHTDGICNAILFPEKDGIGVIVPLKNGSPFRLGILKPDVVGAVTAPTRTVWDLKKMKIAQ